MLIHSFIVCITIYSCILILIIAVVACVWICWHSVAFIERYNTVSCRSLHFSSSLHFASGSSVALSGELLLYKAECGVQRFGTLHFYYKININFFFLCLIVLLEHYSTVFTNDFFVQHL